MTESMTRSNKYSAPRYILGTATHLFTALPTFRSGLEAADYARANSMKGPVYVHEERDVTRLGVVYGIHREIVATVRF